MAININLDVMLAKRKMSVTELTEKVLFDFGMLLWGRFALGDLEIKQIAKTLSGLSDPAHKQFTMALEELKFKGFQISASGLADFTKALLRDGSRTPYGNRILPCRR